MRCNHRAGDRADQVGEKFALELRGWASLITHSPLEATSVADTGLLEIVMLRMLSLVMLGSSSIALAQMPPPPAPEAAQPAELAPPAEEAAPEEPKMKKVCRQVEVVGSAVGRTVCTMKPVRAPKPRG